MQWRKTIGHASGEGGFRKTNGPRAISGAQGRNNTYGADVLQMRATSTRAAVAKARLIRQFGSFDQVEPILLNLLQHNDQIFVATRLEEIRIRKQLVGAVNISLRTGGGENEARN